MHTLAVIIARAGSKGLPDKCVRLLGGRAVIEYTFDHALSASRVDAILLTTDSEAAKALARARGLGVVDRPAELATDTATVDEAARHAVSSYEASHGWTVDHVVLMYGNIPVRADGMIDRAIAKLIDTGADSVRSVALVGKQHPDWIHKLDGDRMQQFRKNSIYRRQDLDPLYYHDGAVAVVTRDALFAAPRWAGDHQGFLGEDRRAIIQQPEDCVDVDGPVDLYLANAILRARIEDQRAQHGPVRIAGRVIGEGEAAYVIAEAGVNHEGSVRKAIALVDAAAAAGADAVKFQMFSADRLVSESTATATYQQERTGATCQHALLKQLELSREDFASIQHHCRQMNIEFLATPFSVADLEQLLSMGVPAIKFASTDLNNPALLQAGVASNLPLICSTGAATAEEIGRAVGDLHSWGASYRTVLLHCVSSYPTPADRANLRAIGELSERFGLPVGYSDHTESLGTGGLAVAAGAVIIEKHFTLDRAAAGPDHSMSLEPGDLERYVASIREAGRMMGDGSLDFDECEAEVRRIARKSVVAARDLSAGDVLSRAHLAVKRPGGGMAPAELDRLIGRRIKADIAADTQLSWEMVL